MPVFFCIMSFHCLCWRQFCNFDLYRQILQFVDYMKHQHHDIKFTFEVEQNTNMPTVVATLISGTKIRKWKTQGLRSWYTPNTCLTLEHFLTRNTAFDLRALRTPVGQRQSRGKGSTLYKDSFRLEFHHFLTNNWWSTYINLYKKGKFLRDCLGLDGNTHWAISFSFEKT